jgi:hypothetical protein
VSTDGGRRASRAHRVFYAPIVALFVTFVAACDFDSKSTEEQFAEDLEKFRASDLTIRYELGTREEADEDMYVTWHKSAQHRWRLDIADPAQSAPLSVLTELNQPDDQGDLYCSSDAQQVFEGTTDFPGGVCSREPSVDMAWTIALAPLLVFDAVAPGDVKVRGQQRRDVSKYRARCYELENADGEAISGRPCFADGVLVGVIGLDDQEAGYRAVSYERGISPSDLEPPYPIVSAD